MPEGDSVIGPRTVQLLAGNPTFVVQNTVKLASGTLVNVKPNAPFVAIRIEPRCGDETGAAGALE